MDRKLSKLVHRAGHGNVAIPFRMCVATHVELETRFAWGLRLTGHAPGGSMISRSAPFLVETQGDRAKCKD